MTENGLMDGTRTEKLFYNDSHLSKFTAMVLECEPYEKKEGCYAVELDRTAFFPEGGGQYADTGKLKAAKVSDVREKNGRILHITDQPFEAGEIVEGEIDWETRFMKMQQHTGIPAQNAVPDAYQQHRSPDLDHTVSHVLPV